MKDVWPVAQIHHTAPLKIKKLSRLGNFGKTHSEQIVLKALEKSLLLPSKVPASLYPTPQLPSWFAWGKGDGTCSPLAMPLPSNPAEERAPRGYSPPSAHWPGASSHLLDSSQGKPHPTRHRRPGILRGRYVHRGCGS